MAYVKNAQNNTSASSDRNAASGYLNINVIARDGSRKRLGGRGIALRESHPLEKAILDFCRANPEDVQSLVNRLELTFGEAAKGDETFDLGL